MSLKPHLPSLGRYAKNVNKLIYDSFSVCINYLDSLDNISKTFNSQFLTAETFLNNFDQPPQFKQVIDSTTPVFDSLKQYFRDSSFTNDSFILKSIQENYKNCSNESLLIFRELKKEIKKLIIEAQNQARLLKEPAKKEDLQKFQE